MRNLDFSSWQGVLSTLAGLAVITLLGVGIRLLVMQTVQQRRERENRQINERLRTLIAAYRTLGGSFTGNLAVDPTHLRDLRTAPDATFPLPESPSSDRSRRMRDAVEAALSDIILFGTEEQVRLASRAATDLVAGKPVHTDELVISLRSFIRTVLDLDPLSADIAIPSQGPARPGAVKAGGRGEGAEGAKGGRGSGADMGAGAGMGMGLGVGVGGSIAADEEPRDQ